MEGFNVTVADGESRREEARMTASDLLLLGGV